MKLPEGAYLYQFIEKQDVPNASDEEWELFVEEYQGAFADAASEIALEMWADFADDERKNKEFQQEWKAILKKKEKVYIEWWDDKKNMAYFNGKGPYWADAISTILEHNPQWEVVESIRGDHPSGKSRYFREVTIPKYRVER